MEILPLREEEKIFLKQHHLLLKWKKACVLFNKNIKHPSLHVELLEPKWRGIFSFRIDRKYRALFRMITPRSVEVFRITNHYKR